jgi:hypothetical protein
VAEVAAMADFSCGFEVAGESPFPDRVGLAEAACILRIWSAVAESMTASGLGFTSNPLFWIRSISSFGFSPSSFASSWTRVDKDNSRGWSPAPWFGRFVSL